MNNPSDIKRRISKEAFLIESLKVVVDGIARTFGSRCEMVLHDIRNLINLDHSIVKIANGHVAGRTVGQHYAVQER
jgi:predicted transcriptional regulator YheO